MMLSVMFGSPQTTAVLYRLRHQETDQLGEIIAHDDLKILQDDRVSFEKKIFQDLAIYKLLV